MKYVNYIESSENRVFTDRNNFDYLVKSNGFRHSNIDAFKNAINVSSLRYSFYLYALYENETIQEDLSSYLTEDGQLTVNLESGIRRRLNVTLYNKENWLPSPVRGFLWKGAKFKLEIGVKTTLAEYIYPAGVFVLNEFEMPHTYVKNTITLDMVDKFGALDGTVGGKIISAINIPVGSKIFDAIKTLLSGYKIHGIPYDVKKIRFPLKFLNATTSYTITKTLDSGGSIGELLKELAMMINQDVFYDEYGNLCFCDMQENIVKNTSASVWSFYDTDADYVSPVAKINLQSVKNVVTVQGANINGNLIDVTVQNNNPKSITNITIFEPTPIRIIDENITSIKYAKERANYELIKNSLLSVSMNFNTLIIPLLDVGNVIEITDSYFKFKAERFIINSISIPINSVGKMSLSINNLEEVGFNG